MTSPFLLTNQVKLKSKNERTKHRPTNVDAANDDPSNIVINLYNGDAKKDRPEENTKNVDRREGGEIPTLKRKRRENIDERLRFFSKNSPQDEESLGEKSVHEGQDHRQPSRSETGPDIVLPINFLNQDSNLPPRSSGMVESLSHS